MEDTKLLKHLISLSKGELVEKLIFSLKTINYLEEKIDKIKAGKTGQHLTNKGQN